MHVTSIAAIALSLLGFDARVAAQENEQTPKKAPPTREQKLAMACQAMSELSSLAYATSHRTTNRVSPFVARGAGQPKERTIATTGACHEGVLKVSIGSGWVRCADSLQAPRGAQVIAVEALALDPVTYDPRGWPPGMATWDEDGVEGPTRPCTPNPSRVPMTLGW